LSDKLYHVIVTHFNVRKFNTILEGNYERTWGDPPTEEWMQKRVELFNRYCYPSIVNQKNQNFEWLVYFDESTDRELVKQWPRITPIFLDTEFDYKRDLCNYLLQSGKLTTWLLSTHLDNDDALNLHYIHEMQDRFNRGVFNDGKKENLFSVNFDNGYWYIENSQLIKQRMYKRNPYMTTIELSDGSRELNTCWCEQHQNMHSKMKILYYRNLPPMWMQVIHGTNFRNHSRGRIIRGRRHKFKLKDSFGFDPKVMK